MNSHFSAFTSTIAHYLQISLIFSKFTTHYPPHPTSIAAVGAFAVESANIVGYNNTAARANLNWYAPCFRSVGVNTTDINDIQLNDDGVGLVGWGDSMQIVGPLGSASEMYSYWDKTMNPAGEDAGNFWADEFLQPVDVELAPGAGFAIDNPNGFAFDVKIKCQN